MEKLEQFAKELNSVSGKFTGIDGLADSLRKGQIPINTIGWLEKSANELSRTLKDLREWVIEEQRKETQFG
jgi:hypothetical protein